MSTFYLSTNQRAPSRYTRVATQARRLVLALHSPGPQSSAGPLALPLRLVAAAGVGGVDARKPIEQGGELYELVVVVMRAHELADLSGVRLVGFAQLVATGLGQHRVGHATIALTLLAPHEAVALEAVEKPRHAARGQQEGLVRVEVQVVIVAELTAQLARDGEAGANQAHERLDCRRGLGGSLCTGHREIYLRPQV